MQRELLSWNYHSTVVGDTMFNKLFLTLEWRYRLSWTTEPPETSWRIDRSWRITVDDHKPNHTVAQTAVAVSDVISLLQIINTASNTWCVAIDLVTVFFSFLTRKKNQKPFIFWMDNSIALPQGYVNLSPSDNTTQRGLGYVDILQNISLVHSTDDIRSIYLYLQLYFFNCSQFWHAKKGIRRRFYLEVHAPC